MSALYYAMWVSEVWHANWRETGSLYAKARAMVLYDRILNGRIDTPKTEDA